MQKFNILLPEDVKVPVTNEHVTILLNDLFQASSAAYNNVISALQYENKPKFGPAAVNNLRLQTVDYNGNSLSGRIRLIYDMQLTFGCEDVIKDHKTQHSYYNFKITHNPAEIYFESDYPDAPSTADEF